ncbi:alpha/beta fold hydrolase [Streptomyces goshikiensis]
MGVANVNGTSLYYEAHGAGRALVFLHGWGTSGRVWDAQAADLSRDHHVITVDWRGCGRSERAATGYTIADVTHDTLGFLDALELKAPVLIGSSIAGAFVLEAALAAPRRIGAVIPVDAGVHHFSAGMREAMAGLLADLRADRAGTLADLVPHWYRPGGRQSRDRPDGATAPGLHLPDRPPRGRPGGLRPPPPPGRAPGARPLPPRRAGHRGPPQGAPGVRGAHPGAGLTVIEGAGHMSQQDQPERFNTALRAALASMPERAA